MTEEGDPYHLELALSLSSLAGSEYLPSAGADPGEKAGAAQPAPQELSRLTLPAGVTTNDTEQRATMAILHGLDYVFDAEQFALSRDKYRHTLQLPEGFLILRSMTGDNVVQYLRSLADYCRAMNRPHRQAALALWQGTEKVADEASAEVRETRRAAGANHPDWQIEREGTSPEALERQRIWWLRMARVWLDSFGNLQSTSAIMMEIHTHRYSSATLFGIMDVYNWLAEMFGRLDQHMRTDDMFYTAFRAILSRNDALNPRALFLEWESYRQSAEMQRQTTDRAWQSRSLRQRLQLLIGDVLRVLKQENL